MWLFAVTHKQLTNLVLPRSQSKQSNYIHTYIIHARVCSYIFIYARLFHICYLHIFVVTPRQTYAFNAHITRGAAKLGTHFIYIRGHGLIAYVYGI